MDDAVFVNPRRKAVIVTGLPPNSDLIFRVFPFYQHRGFMLTTWSAIRSKLKTDPCSWEVLPLLSVPIDNRLLIEGDAI